MEFTNTVCERIRIVVADDHAIFREGLVKLLDTTPDLRVVATAADGEEALKLVPQIEADVLLLDFAMPRMDGLSALKALKATSSRVRVILLTADIDTSHIVAALQFGAQGVMLKESTGEMLFKCIRAVMAGQYWVGRNRVADLVSTLRELATAQQPQQGGRRFGLTPRELEIIRAVLGAYSNNDIAATLSISEKTVKHHLTNIFDKLGVSNRLELALFAMHHKLEPASIALATSAVN